MVIAEKVAKPIITVYKPGEGENAFDGIRALAPTAVRKKHRLKSIIEARKRGREITKEIKRRGKK